MDFLELSGVSIPLAFAAGLLSCLSPCVLPLIPAYLGYLTGASLETSCPTMQAALARHRQGAEGDPDRAQ